MKFIIFSLLTFWTRTGFTLGDPNFIPPSQLDEQEQQEEEELDPTEYRFDEPTDSRRDDERDNFNQIEERTSDDPRFDESN